MYILGFTEIGPPSGPSPGGRRPLRNVKDPNMRYHQKTPSGSGVWPRKQKKPPPKPNNINYMISKVFVGPRRRVVNTLFDRLIPRGETREAKPTP